MRDHLHHLGRSGRVSREATVFLLLACALLLLIPSSATAQDCSTEAVAAMGEQAAEHFQEGEYRAAALLLSQAYECQPLDVLAYNIARAYQQDGRCVMASDYFERFFSHVDELDSVPERLERAFSTAMDEEPGQTACADRYRELLGNGQDALSTGDYSAAESALRQALGTSDEPEARVLMGQVLFYTDCEASLEFFNGVVEDIDLDESQRETMRQGIAQAERCIADRGCAEQRSECEQDRATASQDWRDGVATQKKVGLIITGVGGAVLLGALIHDLIGNGTINDYEDAAAAGNAEEFHSLRDDIDSAKTVSFILYGVGAAAILTGIIVYFTAGGDDPARTIDCSAVCWDWGLMTPTGATGLWVGGAF